MPEIPDEFSGWRQVRNPNTPSIIDLYSRDGLQRVAIGTMTGAITYYRRRSTDRPFVYQRVHQLDPFEQYRKRMGLSSLIRRKS